LWAAEHKQREVVIQLLNDSRADGNARDSHGETVLIYAIWYALVSIVKRQLAAEGVES
jgi:ankyrin repeat protein